MRGAFFVSGLAVLVACKQAPPTATHLTASSAGLRLTSYTHEAKPLASVNPLGGIEVVALFEGAMPTGVTVSRSGRIFVSFPRWGDDVPFTVAELKDKKAVAFPDDKTFVSVQSVVVDPLDRLWALDAGGPKLVAIDLATDAITKTIVFPRDVALPTSYFNDVRFDLSRGKGGFAFITDSSGSGPNGIVVVDLASGRSWRRLHDHPSTKADKSFVPLVEGRVLAPLTTGADGIALSNDGKTLYYCPLAGRHLFAVSTDALVNESLPDSAVAHTVRDLGEKGASVGLESDAEGRVYLTEYEANAILRRNTNGSLETLVVDPRVLWPDTLSLADDGFLYFTANQLERSPRFHDGHDMRDKPYALFRVKVDGSRLRLKP